MSSAIPHPVTRRPRPCRSRLSAVKRRLAVHLAFWLVGAAVVRVALLPAEVCPPVTAAQVEQAILEASDWMALGHR